MSVETSKKQVDISTLKEMFNFTITTQPKFRRNVSLKKRKKKTDFWETLTIVRDDFQEMWKERVVYILPNNDIKSQKKCTFTLKGENPGMMVPSNHKTKFSSHHCTSHQKAQISP